MSWWIIPAIIGVIAAAIALGLLISYIILKRQKRPWPFSHRSTVIEVDHRPAAGTAAVRSPDKAAGAAAMTGAALLELEHNLKIATGPVTNSLLKYQIEVWNTKRSEFDVLDSALLGEVTEVYVDVILANNIVWMASELGQNSQNLTDDYAKLSSKIAERLKRIMPAVRKSFQ